MAKDGSIPLKGFMSKARHLSSGDRLQWLDERVTVLDVGEYLSDVDGVHVEIQSPSRPPDTTVVHERLIDDWFVDDSKSFRVVQ